MVKYDVRTYQSTTTRNLNVVDVHFVLELECTLVVLLTKVVLVDLGVFWKFAVCFHWKRKMECIVWVSRPAPKGADMRRTVPRLVSSVFDNNIRLIILEISKRKQDDISLIDPHLVEKPAQKSKSIRDWSKQEILSNTPFSSSSLGYVLISSHHRNIEPPNDHFQASWLLEHIPDHPRGKLVHACRRRSRSFHVSDSFLPVKQCPLGEVINTGVYGISVYLSFILDR